MSDKKERIEDNSHAGLLGWSLGMAGLLFSVMQPFAGIILGVAGLAVSSSQYKKFKNEWSRSGKIISIVALVVSVAVIVISYYVVQYFKNKPELLRQLQGWL